MRVRRFLPAFFAILFAAIASGQNLSHVPPNQRAEAARLFKIYRGSADLPSRAQAAEALSQMDPAVVLALVTMLERDWERAVTDYLSAIPRVAEKVARRRASDRSVEREVASLRATMARLRSGGGLTMERLRDEGGPALRRLRELYTISKSDLIAAQPSLGPAAEAARALTRMRVMLSRKARLKDSREYTEADLAKQEAALMARAFHPEPKAEKVLAANAVIAAKCGMAAEEIEGVRSLNELRMMLGLAPVLIDPRLQEAARGHSQDMVTIGFFAHESSVPGKQTPWARARLAGTTASAENIYAGSDGPDAVNETWLFSPGHHVNMLGAHRRVGMARCGGSWTQLFGR